MATTAARSPRDRSSTVAAILIGLLASGVMVLTASRAAFTDTTDNTGNAISTGTVVLVDDDSGSAMFNVAGMAPGDSAVTCIAVTYQGTITNPGAVRLYSGGYTDSGTLGAELNLVVEEGTGSSFGDCSGFTASGTIESGTLAGFDTTHSDYASGAGTWDPSSTPESRSYRFTVSLPTTADNSAQGQSITNLTFTWEVQS